MCGVGKGGGWGAAGGVGGHGQSWGDDTRKPSCLLSLMEDEEEEEEDLLATSSQDMFGKFAEFAGEVPCEAGLFHEPQSLRS